MYEHTIDRLARAGLAMYEISNFARPGHESRHNLVYWANDAYFGVGLGAARYVGGVRSVNTRDLPAYLRRIEAGEPATGPTETLDPEARARETAVLMLRRTVLGIDRADFARRTGFDLDALAGPVAGPARRRGACSKTTAAASGSPARGSSWPTASCATSSEGSGHGFALFNRGRGDVREFGEPERDHGGGQEEAARVERGPSGSRRPSRTGRRRPSRRPATMRPML